MSKMAKIVDGRVRFTLPDLLLANRLSFRHTKVLQFEHERVQLLQVSVRLDVEKLRIVRDRNLHVKHLPDGWERNFRQLGDRFRTGRQWATTTGCFRILAYVQCIEPAGKFLSVGAAHRLVPVDCDTFVVSDPEQFNDSERSSSTSATRGERLMRSEPSSSSFSILIASFTHTSMLLPASRSDTCTYSFTSGRMAFAIENTLAIAGTAGFRKARSRARTCGSAQLGSSNIRIRMACGG
uniref:Uncharacterized protein n=1 Tax=Anopheles maculatus TaxID=74869 RepID=A0A182SYZ5_9DIPT